MTREEHFGVIYERELRRNYSELKDDQLLYEFSVLQQQLKEAGSELNDLVKRCAKVVKMSHIMVILSIILFFLSYTLRLSTAFLILYQCLLIFQIASNFHRIGVHETKSNRYKEMLTVFEIKQKVLNEICHERNIHS